MQTLSITINGVNDAPVVTVPGTLSGRLFGATDVSGLAITDADGEYWFKWLAPGRTYSVREIPPDGSVQTTDDPPPMFIGSGVEFVATAEQGREVQRAVSFQWWWILDIVPVGSDHPVSVMVAGMATIGFTDLFNPETHEVVPLIDEQTLLPAVIPQGSEWLLGYRLLEMELVGIDPVTGGDMAVRATGEGTILVSNVGPSPEEGLLEGTVEGLFDFSIAIDLPLQEDPMVLRPDRPIRVHEQFTSEDGIPPRDVRWLPTMFMPGDCSW